MALLRMAPRPLTPASRMSIQAVRAWWVGVLVVSLLFVRIPLDAANGDVQRVFSLLAGTGATDLTFDSAGSAFWVSTRIDGNVYCVNLALDSILEALANPHGVGAFPNFVSTFGVAYRSTPQPPTLLLLAQVGANWLIREMSLAGIEVGSAFNLTPSDPTTARFRGLTYDPTNDEMWTLNANNDELVRFDLSGNVTRTLPVPRSNVMADIDLYGDGVAYLDTGSPSLYVSFGDLFEVAPSELVQLALTGESTGVELPLFNVPGSPNRGFELYQAGPQVRCVMITAQGDLVELEHTVPSTPPPSWLDCLLTRSNQVVLTWQNNGPGVNSAYNGSLRILRDGNPVATVPGNARAFTDVNPQPGTARYTVQPTDPPGTPASAPCKVTVGTGGLNDWKLLTGTRPFDVARDPATGDLYVTDTIEGSIFVYNEDFEVQGEIPSPWDDPGPIAFVPEITISNVIVNNLLAVGSTAAAGAGVTVQFVALLRLDGTPETTLTFLTGVERTQFGGLTYDVDRQEFSTIELVTRDIFVFNKLGNLVETCFPRGQGVPVPPLDIGISFDRLAQNYVATFQDGAVRDMFAEPDPQGGCVVSGLQFPLESLGAGFDTLGYIGGIQMDANTLVVVGRVPNVLFRVLLQPFTSPFERGDVDLNGSININDAVLVANHLFAGEPLQLACQDAADANDDGQLDIGDPVYLIFFLFASGPAPPPPFGSAGIDPTFRDNLGCES